jgi:hypothetical protein
MKLRPIQIISDAETVPSTRTRLIPTFANAAATLPIGAVAPAASAASTARSERAPGTSRHFRRLVEVVVAGAHGGDGAARPWPIELLVKDVR